MVIAIDGPAGSGKSTIAKLIAEKLQIIFLNSGSFYRAITLVVLNAGIAITDTQKILELAQSLTFDYVNSHLYLNGKDVESQLRTEKIDANAAQVSCIIPLRHLVNEHLRNIGSMHDVICEGRDITTVVFPNADYKFYLDASLEAKAERRYNQGQSNLSLEEIKQGMAKRDSIDKNKKEGALQIADDAHYIDTTYLTINQVCEIILSKING